MEFRKELYKDALHPSIEKLWLGPKGKEVAALFYLLSLFNEKHSKEFNRFQTNCFIGRGHETYRQPVELLE